MRVQAKCEKKSRLSDTHWRIKGEEGHSKGGNKGERRVRVREAMG